MVINRFVGGILEITLPNRIDFPIRTGFGVDECMRRLREAADRGDFSSLFGIRLWKYKPVIAKFRGNQFVLRKQINYRNPFVPNYYGQLSPAGRGTQVEGYFQVSLTTRIFQNVFLLVSLILLLGAVSSALRDKNLSGNFLFVLFSGGIVGFVIAQIRFGHLLGKREEHYLKDFLRTTLAVREGDKFSSVDSGGTSRVDEN